MPLSIHDGQVYDVQLHVARLHQVLNASEWYKDCKPAARKHVFPPCASAPGACGASLQDMARRVCHAPISLLAMALRDAIACSQGCGGAFCADAAKQGPSPGATTEEAGSAIKGLDSWAGRSSSLMTIRLRRFRVCEHGWRCVSVSLEAPPPTSRWPVNQAGPNSSSVMSYHEEEVVVRLSSETCRTSKELCMAMCDSARPW